MFKERINRLRKDVLKLMVYKEGLSSHPGTDEIYEGGSFFGTRSLIGLCWAYRFCSAISFTHALARSKAPVRPS